MNEASQVHQESADCLLSQSDHGKLSQRIKARRLDCHKQDEKSGTQKLVKQTNSPEKSSARIANTTKASSRKGKLSLRRDTNRPCHSREKASAEVMKVILGETTLNQSSDFKEPQGCQVPFHESKGRRGPGSALSRSKSSKARKNLTSAPVQASTLKPQEELTGADAGSHVPCTVTGVQLNTLELSDDSSTRSLASTGTLNSIRKSPVNACSVFVSKLKLSTDSLSHTKWINEAASSKIDNSATDNPTKYSNMEPEPTSLTETNKQIVQDQAGDAARNCPVCQEVFLGDDATDNLQQHVQMCLRQRFTKSIQSRDFTGNSDDTSGDEEFARMLQQREEEKLLEERLTDTEKYFCQICQRELSHMNSTRRTQHINRCMDSKETIEPPQEPVASGHQPARRTVPDCPICGKHFKTKRQRESHLKKCARVNQVAAQQLIELVKVQEEAAAQTEGSGGSIRGSTRGPTGDSREGSLEGSTGVTTDGSVGGSAGGSIGGSVEGSAGGSKGGSTGGSFEDPAAGDALGSTHVPGSSESTIRRGRGGRKNTRGRSTTRGKGRRKPQVPVETQPPDEETQVALALSASLVQQPDPGPSTGGAVAHLASATGAPKPPGRPGRKKKTGRKEGNKEVPLLVKRTEEERSRLLEARMADIILPQEDATVQKTPSMNKSVVARRHRQPSVMEPRTCIHLAEAAAAAGQRDDSHTESSLGKALKQSETVPLWSLASDSTSSSQTSFYVHQLLPVVTPKKQTSSRQVTSIGEPATPLKQSQVLLNQNMSPLKDTPHTSAPSPRNVSFTLSQEGPATQALGRTVQILADLAAEGALPACTTQSSDHSLITASGFIPTNEEEHLNREHSEGSMTAVNEHQMEILQSLAGLVNSKNLSDLHLVASDNSVIYAHQFIIKLRCPSLAKLIEESPSCSSSAAKRLILPDYNHDAVLCALHFIYSGKETVTSSTADGVWKFAKRFSIPKLCDVCCKFRSEPNDSRMGESSLKSELDSSPQRSIKEDGQESEDFFANRGLDDLIQSLWDRSDEEADDKFKEDSDEASDDSDDHQTKRRLSHRLSDTESDNEGKDSAPDDKDLDEIYEFFSTQRQQCSQRSLIKKSEESSNAESVESAEDDGDDSGEEDEEKSEKLSANSRRQSLTIVEQLQSSCLPQSQRSPTKTSPHSGDVNSKQPQDHVLQIPTAKRIKTDGSSKGVAQHTTSSSDSMTTCFVHVKRLSNDLPVSPLKDKHTVGTCLEVQCNLKTGHMESRQPEPNEPGGNTRNCTEVPSEDSNILHGAYATLADVGDSIFQNYDENEEDVEMLDVSQSSKSDHQNQPSTIPSPRVDMEDGHTSFNQSADLLGSVSSERDKNHRCISVSSDSEDETLPRVNDRSQPEELEDGSSFGNSSEEKMVFDEGPELSISVDAKEQSGDCGKDAVIDLSQDDEDQEIESVKSSNEKDDIDNSKDVIQDDLSESDEDEDIPVTVPQSPEFPMLDAKVTSKPSKTYLTAKEPSPGKNSVVKPPKFKFRRRDRQVDTKVMPVRTEPTEVNTFRTPAVNRMESTKPKCSDTFTSMILETPAAFRADVGIIRDSSTPDYGTRSGGVFSQYGRISPKISPVKKSRADDAQGKGQKSLSSNYSDAKSADSLNQNAKSLKIYGSPDFKIPSKDSLNKKDTFEDTRNTRSTKATVFETNREGRSGQEDSGPDSPLLQDTPVRPTPDCFDPDTPEIVSCMPAAPLSPSPPPSPTFGSFGSQKTRDAASTSSEQQHLEDTITEEGSAREESFSTRRKRKLQQEDLELENVEAPSKRAKGPASNEPSHSVINTNILSPVCTTDEDDVVLISNEEGDGDVLKSSKSGPGRAKAGTAVRNGEVSWPEQLCVGQSPTRYSPESSSSDEAEICQDANHDSSTPIIQVDKASVPKATDSLKDCIFPVSPAKDSKYHSSSRNFPGPESWSKSLVRRKDSKVTANQRKPKPVTLSQKSASDVESLPSPSLENASQEQFAYFGDDGGGYMDDFDFCSDGERDAGEVDVEVIASERKSPSHTETNRRWGGGTVSHVEKPTTSNPSPFKSSSGIRRGLHHNLSIHDFSSSEEDTSPPKLSSRLGDIVGVLSTSQQLQEEAEEFGCSESFLCELKAGHVDEETAWGGVKTGGGGLDAEQSQKKSSQVGKQVPATPVVGRKQPMNKDTIDKLYHPPAPVTPMPPYDEMNTPGLKNELKRYGVKPLPKKKARLKLKEIYDFTHQVLEDSDSDGDISGPTFKLPSAATKRTSSNPTSRQTASKKCPTRKNKKAIQSQRSKGHQASKEEMAAVSQPVCSETSSGGDRESCDSDDSEYGSSRKCPGGNEEDEEEDDDYLEPSQRTAANLEEAIKTYIKTNHSLYEKILCYEPLELNKFQAELKSAGIKYSKNKLREFLDYHCITCQLVTSSTNRHVRKPKQPKSK